MAMNRLHAVLGFLSLLLCIHLHQDHRSNQLLWDSIKSITDEPNRNSNNDDNNGNSRPNNRLLQWRPASSDLAKNEEVSVVEIVDGKPWLEDRIRPEIELISVCSNKNNNNITDENSNSINFSGSINQNNKPQPRKKCGFNATITSQSNNRIIDYAILGFAKCGSTTVGSALGKIGQAPKGDTCLHIRDVMDRSYRGWKNIYGAKPGDNSVPLRRNNQNVLTGIKCPAGIEIQQIIQPWTVYQPQTLLIVGIRHPVSSFESFYNHLVKKGWKFDDPHAMLSRCKNKRECSERGCPADSNKVLCTDRLRYHVSLAKLGKTPLGKTEKQLLPFNGAERPFRPNKVPNKVFLYEVSQLSDTNENRDELFWSDLSRALELPRSIHIHPQNVTTVKPASSSSFSSSKPLPPFEQKRRAARTIDICAPANDDLREVLMRYSRQAADWICPYFLAENTGVMVSDRDYFCNVIMERWRHDPCYNNNNDTHEKPENSNNDNIAAQEEKIRKLRAELDAEILKQDQMMQYKK